MFNFVFKTGNQAKIDSRRVAKAFGKRHADVICANKNHCTKHRARLENQKIKLKHRFNSVMVILTITTKDSKNNKTLCLVQ